MRIDYAKKPRRRGPMATRMKPPSEETMRRVQRNMEKHVLRYLRQAH